MPEFFVCFLRSISFTNHLPIFSYRHFLCQIRINQVGVCLRPRELCGQYICHAGFSFIIGESDKVQILFGECHILPGSPDLLFSFRQFCGGCGELFQDIVRYIALLQLLYADIGFLLAVCLEAPFFYVKPRADLQPGPAFEPDLGL